MQMRINKYKGVTTNFKDFAENRDASFCLQFNTVFRRNVVFMARNNRFIAGLFGQSVFFALLINCLFWKALKFPDILQIAESEGDPVKAQEAVANALNSFVLNTRGISFLIAAQSAMAASMSAILQVPLQAPVMNREIANKMYTPTTYYLGRFWSNIIV